MYVLSTGCQWPAIPTRTTDLLLAEPRDAAASPRPAPPADTTTAPSGQMTLPRCRKSGESLKQPSKTTASVIAPNSAAAFSIACSAKPNQRITTD
jgi:hypothetical protein